MKLLTICYYRSHQYNADKKDIAWLSLNVDMVAALHPVYGSDNCTLMTFTRPLNLGDYDGVVTELCLADSVGMVAKALQNPECYDHDATVKAGKLQLRELGMAEYDPVVP